MPKAVLTNPRLTAADSTKQYMVEGIRKVCDTFKKRLPGTQSERDAQAFFKGELEKISDPAKGDTVLMEDFTLHPHAFMGFIPVAALFLLGNIACFWLGKDSVALAVLGAALSLLAVLMFLFEFLMYREFVDFLFPKRVSRNVYAVRKPSGETKRRIILGGHTDAANEWTYSWLGEGTGLGIAIFGAVLSMLLGLVASVVRLVTVVMANAAEEANEVWTGKGTAYDITGDTGMLGWGIALLCTLPFIFAIMKFINYKVVTDGANDNISANYIAMALLKELHDAGARFENTEVACLLTGAEEAGLRGAKAFAKKHAKELSDVETVFISLDTMREIKEMRVCNFGCTGTVKNDKAVGDLLHTAAANCGADIPDSELYPGAVDAEAFSMYGLRSTGFTAVSHAAKRYYHTRLDTPDNIDEDCLTLSLNICKEAVRLFDETGMAPFDAKRKK
ncbi:MAG: Zn-dependent exopeptidase M28 [Oscillospiraceae bacterium]|jgi:hypothetical protein|nr:Zn-dependent exopeptidase M28 [Oscillospiraceae bacterium]